jgi:biotin carboxylase
MMQAGAAETRVNGRSAPHVLILGAGVMQFPALRAARSMGWRVTVADANNSAPGIPMADRFLHVDLADAEGMVSAAGEIKAEEGLDGVFTAGTDFSYTVARVAEALGLPGVGSEAARRASDKAVMRQAFREAGVASPRFVALSAEGEGGGASWKKLMEEHGLNLPLVVKPVDNMGARGVRRVDTPEELEEAAAAALADSRTGRAVLEEYIPGPEFSLDAVVQEGRVSICGFADRHIRLAPYFVEMGHTMPTTADEPVRRQVAETFSRAIAALGIRNGQAKGDIKWTGSEAVAGEVAARLSGGYMSGWTYPYSSGIDLTAAALRQAVGLDPGALQPSRDHVTAERAFLSIPGRVEAVEDFSAAENTDLVRNAFTRISAGDEVRFPRNNVEKGGNFIASSADRQAAVWAAEEACRRVFVRLEPGDERTFSFLFEGAEAWAPDAFSISSGANRRRLTGMPSYLLPGKEAADRKHRGGGAREGRGETADRAETAVLALPDSEDSADWHGCGWERALDEVQRRCRTPLRLITEGSSAGTAFVLGSLFWRAFLRGGIQGAVWTVDTLAEELKGGRLSARWERLQ